MKLEKIPIEFFSHSFYSEYLELLVSRIAHSTMSLEEDLGNTDDSKNAIRLRDSMKAFKYLIQAINNQENLSEELIKKTADIINESSIYIARGYRHIGNYLADTTIPISEPEEIEKDLNKLLQRYHTTWKNLDPYEREARFHIDFIRIHPFEDGNGRTGRLLLNFNLIHQKLPPVIITEDLREYYQSYIRNYDVEGMKNLFRIQSKKEQQVIEQLHQSNQEEVKAIKH